MGMKEFEPIFANDGYRPNVGIVICNKNGMVFWARRIKRDGWQFPQGGVAKNETLQEAMYRELREETGLAHHQVRIISHTAKWIRYELPNLFAAAEPIYRTYISVARQFYFVGRSRCGSYSNSWAMILTLTSAPSLLIQLE